MVKFQFLSLLLLGSFTFAQDDRATDPNNHFNNPPPAGSKIGTNPAVLQDNVVFPEGVATTFQWVTSSSNPLDIRLVKEGPENLQLLLCSKTTDTSCPWDGGLGGKITLSTESSDVFFLGAWDSVKSGAPLFYSHYFNISRAEGGSSSDSSSTTTSTTTTMTTTTTTTSSTTTTTSESTTTTAVSTSSSVAGTSGSSTSRGSAQATQVNSATAIGAGVGAGIGGALLILGALFFIWYRRQQNRKHANGGLPSHQPPPFYDMNQPRPPYSYYPTAPQSHDLPFHNDGQKYVYQQAAAELAPGYSQRPPGAELATDTDNTLKQPGQNHPMVRSELSGDLK